MCSKLQYTDYHLLYLHTAEPLATVQANPNMNSASVHHSLPNTPIPYWESVAMFKDLAPQVQGWRELARCLQCAEFVKQIERRYVFESEQCYHMLEIWWEKRDEKGTYSELACALQSSRQDNLISVLQAHLESSSGSAASPRKIFTIDLSRDEEIFPVGYHVTQLLQEQKGRYSRARVIVFLDK